MTVPGLRRRGGGRHRQRHRRRLDRSLVPHRRAGECLGTPHCHDRPALTSSCANGILSGVNRRSVSLAAGTAAVAALALAGAHIDGVDRERPLADAPHAGAGRPERLGPLGGRRRRRPRLRQDGVRAQSRPAARARVEREARSDLCGAQGARARLRVPHRGARRRLAGRIDLARQHRAEGLRRPDAHVARAEAAGQPARQGRDPAGDRPADRRRVVVRHRPHRAGLEGVVLPRGVPAAVGARRGRRPGR